MRTSLLFVFFALVVGLSACADEPPPPPKGDLAHIPYNPQAYLIKKPAHFPEVPVPADNPMTNDGVQLGRRLFYDPILSADSTMSCASCHLPAFNFTDGKNVSVGIDGVAGKRSSMSLLNIAYVNTGLFWDGRTATLEAQALLPVEDPIELHHTWPEVEEKLRAHPEYPQLFRKAFGISDRSEINKILAVKAIAQFERILISSGESIYDRFLAGETQLLQDEALDGKLMFFDEGFDLGLPDGECFHCHGTGTLTGGRFFNNGLDPFDQITDIGQQAVTGNPSDKGKFRAPTLRNIALSAPFMHDGRFATLEECMEHYLFRAHSAPNADPNMNLLINKRSVFTNYHKEALVAFLHTLTDTTFINNPDIQNPF